jgi:hypothetical protein
MRYVVQGIAVHWVSSLVVWVAVPQMSSVVEGSAAHPHQICIVVLILEKVGLDAVGSMVILNAVLI